MAYLFHKSLDNLLRASLSYWLPISSPHFVNIPIVYTTLLLLYIVIIFFGVWFSFHTGPSISPLPTAIGKMMATSNSQAQLYHYHCHYRQAAQTGIELRSFMQCTRNTKQLVASANVRVAVANDCCWFCGKLSNNSMMSSRNRFAVKATKTDEEKQEGEEEEKYEEYEVELERPFGLKFAKGRDGKVYIDAIAPGQSADKTGKFSVGDKVIATSAMFGTEVWPAAEYGRTMYTIRQRIGSLYMKMQKRYGNLDYTGEMSEKEIIRAERNAGFISDRIREIQVQNYQRKKEQKQRREQDLREGLQLYKLEKYEEAREKFESVLGSRPTADEASVANYNVACCYSKLNQIQAGLSALEDALESGYEDFKRIRTDPDLANLRTTDEFENLMQKFDESFINPDAINAIKSLFGFGKK